MTALAPGVYWVGNQKFYCITFDSVKKYVHIKSHVIHVIEPKTVIVVSSFVEDTAWNLFDGKEKIDFNGNYIRNNIWIPEKAGGGYSAPDTLLRRYTILYNELVVYRHEFLYKDILGDILTPIEKLTRFSGKKRQRNLGTRYPGNKK